MGATQSIHPFPARMAPEIAIAEVASLPANSVVLDPMTGSGTVLRAAVSQGHRGIGFDMDPLAVLMATVATTAIEAEELERAAVRAAASAASYSRAGVSLPWIDEDHETTAFIDYWFATGQRNDLRCLASVLQRPHGAVGNGLKLAMSRLIITKDRGASLARDVSHSRPHRVRDNNDFPVLEEFVRSAHVLARRLTAEPPPRNATITLGDARQLTAVSACSVDAVITSPPYLNAIDYMRGHRLALVWLGYQVGTLRSIRSSSIGAERGPEADADFVSANEITARVPNIELLPLRQQRLVHRYVLDMFAVMREVSRVLRTGGKAVLVVGNSCLKGVFIENTRIVLESAARTNLSLVGQHERPIPPSRRYMPPPTLLSGPEMEKRMRTEVVLSFQKGQE